MSERPPIPAGLPQINNAPVSRENPLVGRSYVGHDRVMVGMPRGLDPIDRTRLLEIDQNLARFPDEFDVDTLAKTPEDIDDWLADRKGPTGGIAFTFRPVQGDAKNLGETAGWMLAYNPDRDERREWVDNGWISDNNRTVVVSVAKHPEAPSDIIESGVQQALTQLQEMHAAVLKRDQNQPSMNVVASTHPDNPVSQELAEKCGFVFKGQVTDEDGTFNINVLDHAKLNTIMHEKADPRISNLHHL